MNLEHGRPAPDDVDASWRAYRRLVWDIAYRILGTVADAEDVAQETYLRLVEQQAAIANPKGWLTTVATRTALDRLRAHEHRRRAYVGPWLPEPLVVDDALPLDERITLDDTVRMALMVVLEQLTPAERTAFILHDAFGMPFIEIAEILGSTPDACRQHASRARRRISDDSRPRFPLDAGQARELCERFAHACRDGNLDGLVAVLAPDVDGDFDSGGLIPGAPLGERHGAGQIARQLLRAFAAPDLTFATASVNGELGLVVRRHDRVVTVLAFAYSADAIAVVHGIGNPAKLEHLNARQRRTPRRERAKPSARSSGPLRRDAS